MKEPCNQTEQTMTAFDEVEIIRLKDKIYDLRQLVKSLEIKKDEKAFKHRCIPQKREEAEKAVIKSLLPLILMTALGVGGMVGAVQCLMIIARIGSDVSAGLGITLLGMLLYGMMGLIFGTWLWVYALRKLAYIWDLRVDRKKLQAEIAALQAQIGELQKEIEACASELAERKEADYLRTIDYEEEIDMDNLRRYLSGKFASNKELEKRIGAPEVIAELRRFGYKTIGDIDSVFGSVPEDFFIPEEGTNGAGILRNVMIIKDCHKYFAESYKGSWLQIPIERVKFWQEKGAADVGTYLKEYGIEIKL